MTKSKMANRYSLEVCARAVLMVFEHLREVPADEISGSNRALATQRELAVD